MAALGLRIKITVFWTFVILLLASLVGYLMYAASARLFTRSFLDGQLALTAAIADAIDGDIHASFTGPEVVNREEYRRYLVYLHKVKEENPYISYLYTLLPDPDGKTLRYAVEAEMLSSDTVWIESEEFALWLFFRQESLILGYQEEEHTEGFPVEIGRSKVEMEIREADGLPKLWLGGVLVADITRRSPLVVESPVGVVDTISRSITGDVVIGGHGHRLTYGFTGAGESGSTPGAPYIDTPQTTEHLLSLLRSGEAHVDRAPEQDNHGWSLSAYGIIRDRLGRPAGLVAMDFYLKELDAFLSRLAYTAMAIAGGTFVVVLAISLLLSQYLLVPLRRLSAAVEEVTDGKLTTRIRMRRTDEYGQLARGLNRMVDSIQRYLLERELAEAELSRLAYYDQLTELPNRKSFHDRLRESLAAARRSKSESLRGLLILDLDQFKDVNDTMGHQTGDLVLQIAAARIRQHVRQSDLVFRQGGDEFAVLLTTLHAATDAAVVAQKLVRAFADPIEVGASTLHLGLSVGIALFPRDGSNDDELIRCADTALYEAKKDRSSYRYFAESMQQRASDRLAVVNGIHRGIAEGQFGLHFQPVMDMDERLAGCEALLRWNHPEWGSVSPGRFIPLAEETGLILPLGRLGLGVACGLLKRLDELGKRSVRVSVNLSVKQLRDKNLVTDVDACLMRSGIDGHRLELEITETGLMDEAAAVSQIQELRSRGIAFSIDDFGTGYSSVSRLKSLPIDTLKIDRSFVAATPGSRRDCDLVRAVITMAHGLGQKVCAEGVETREQLEFLRSAGCDKVQGYLFSPAVPEEDFLEIVMGRPASP